MLMETDYEKKKEEEEEGRVSTVGLAGIPKCPASHTFPLALAWNFSVQSHRLWVRQQELKHMHHLKLFNFIYT